ncbi:hypothetical protein D3C86_1851050 [compost metagenome]
MTDRIPKLGNLDAATSNRLAFESKATVPSNFPFGYSVENCQACTACFANDVPQLADGKEA